MSIGKNSEDIFEHLGEGLSSRLRISYVRESTPRGTEGALEMVKSLIGSEPFFALNGDQIFKMDMEDMYRQHMANKALATMALTPANSKSRFGVIGLEGNKVISFVQKHEPGEEPTLVNAGIYLFNPDIFDFIDDRGGRMMLEESLFPRLVGMGKLYGYVFSDPWCSLDSTTGMQKSITELERTADAIEKTNVIGKKGTSV